MQKKIQLGCFAWWFVWVLVRLIESHKLESLWERAQRRTAANKKAVIKVGVLARTFSCACLENEWAASFFFSFSPSLNEVSDPVKGDTFTAPLIYSLRSEAEQRCWGGEGATANTTSQYRSIVHAAPTTGVLLTEHDFISLKWCETVWHFSVCVFTLPAAYWLIFRVVRFLMNVTFFFH